MRKQMKLLLLVATVFVLFAMTMLIGSASAEAPFAVLKNGALVSEHTTIEEAYTAVKAGNGDTIRLDANVTLNATVTLDKSVTIDGNGKTLTLSSTIKTNDNWVFYLQAASATEQITLKNMTIKHSLSSASGSGGAGTFFIGADGVYLLEGITSKNAAEVLTYASKASITLKNCVLSSSNTRLAWGMRSDTGNALDRYDNYDKAKLAGGAMHFIDCTLSATKSGQDLFSMEGIGTELTFHNCTMTSAHNFLYSKHGGLQIKVTGKTTVTAADRGIYPAGAGGEYNGKTYRNNVVIGTPDGDDDISFVTGGATLQVRGTDHTLTIYSGSFECNTTTGTNPQTIDIRSGVGTINIYGGSFKNTESKPVIYNTIENYVINIYGGYFTGDQFLSLSQKTTVYVQYAEAYVKRQALVCGAYEHDITIDGGKFITYGNEETASGRANIYTGSGSTNMKITINGGFFGFVDVEDPDNINLNVSSVYKNAESGSTTTYNIYITNPNAKVVVNGGVFMSGQSNGCIRFQGTDCGITINDGKFYGYAWVRFHRTSSLVVNGGSFYNNPGQDNCRGFCLDSTIHDGGSDVLPRDCRIDIYGGSFNITENAGATTGIIFSAIPSHRDYVDENETDKIYQKHTMTVNIYGGSFVDNSNVADHAMFFLGSSAVTVNAYGAGVPIKDAEGKDTVTAGATFTKPNGGYIARVLEYSYTPDDKSYTAFYGPDATLNIYGGSFEQFGGTMFKAEVGHLNITGGTFAMSKGTYFDVAAAADFNWVSTAESRITFVLNQGTPFVGQFDDNWATCHFVLNSWMLDITQGMTFASLEELQGFIAAFLEDEVFSGVASYPYQNFYTELAADTYGEEQNLWMPLAQLPIINVNAPGKTVIIKNVSGTVCTTFATLQAGTLVLENCEIEDVQNVYDDLPLVDVMGVNTTLAVIGGVYTNNGGGNAFAVGVLNTLTSGITATFTDVTIYCVDGGNGISARYIDALAVNGGYISWSKDIVKGTILDKNADLPACTLGITAIFSRALTTTVNGTVIYSGASLAAIEISDTNLREEGPAQVAHINNVTCVGYRAIYVCGTSVVNIYSGNFYSNPGQLNHKLVEFKNGTPTVNVYGGTFTTLGDNATYINQGIFQIEEGEDATLNIYGGTFIVDDAYGSPIVDINAKGRVTVYAAGESYVAFDGSAATSTGASFVRKNGAGYIFNLSSAEAVLVVKGGNFTISDGAAVLNNKNNAASATFESGSFVIAAGGLLPDVNDEQGYGWANCQFRLEGLSGSFATMNVGQTLTVRSLAEAIAAAEALLAANFGGTAIKPGIGGNLTLGLTSYVPFKVVEGASLTIEGLALELAGELAIVEGGSLTINGGSYTTSGDVIIDVMTGSLTVNGGTFINAKGDMIVIRPGAAVTVLDGVFTKGDSSGKGSGDSVGIFHMQGGSLTIHNGTFTCTNGGNVVYYHSDKGETATVLVKGGTFKRMNYKEHGGAVTDKYTEGSIFFFRGSKGSEEAPVGAILTVEGGTFISSSFVRIYTVNTLDGTYQTATKDDQGNITTPASVSSTTNGTVVYIKGGTFIDNTLETHGEHTRYLFQIARAGASRIVITEECNPVVVTATPYTGFFYVNASDVATNHSVEVKGGTYKGGLFWAGHAVTMKSFVFENATFTEADGEVKGLANKLFIFAKTTEVTFTNCTIDVNSPVDVFVIQNSAKLTLNNCTVTQSKSKTVGSTPYGKLFNAQDTSEVTVNGGTYIQKATAALADGSGSSHYIFNDGLFVAEQKLMFSDRGGFVTANGGIFVVSSADPYVFRSASNSMSIKGAVVLTQGTQVCVNRVTGAVTGNYAEWGAVTVNSDGDMHVKLGASALEVTYAGKTYKLWVKDSGDFENAASAGASVFVDASTESQSGLRFETVIAKDVIDALLAKSEYEGASMKYYTLIAPLDYVAAVNGVFTKAALSTLDVAVPYVEIEAVKTLKTDDGVKYSGALINLKSYTRNYVAVSVIEVVKDGQVIDTLYSDFCTTANARTAQQVAEAVIADGYNATWSDAQKAIVDKYATGVKG